MLQVCLVGTGRMGQLRAPILYANPRAELSYVVDVVEKAAGQLAAVYQCGEVGRAGRTHINVMLALEVCAVRASTCVAL